MFFCEFFPKSVRHAAAFATMPSNPFDYCRKTGIFFSSSSFGVYAIFCIFVVPDDFFAALMMHHKGQWDFRCGRIRSDFFAHSFTNKTLNQGGAFFFGYEKKGS